MNISTYNSKKLRAVRVHAAAARAVPNPGMRRKKNTVYTNRSQQPRRVQHRRPHPSILANREKQKEKNEAEGEQQELTGQKRKRAADATADAAASAASELTVHFERHRYCIRYRKAA
jgi:hypothetical protein